MAFNGVGRFSIAPSKTLPLNGWTFRNGEDHGAQYFSANPTFDTAGFWLMMSRQSKARGDGGVSYGFTVFNTDNSPFNIPIYFDVQGGGFANGFNGRGKFTIGPSAKIPLNGWRFGSGEDHGAQYFSANPTSSNGSMLVMSDQNKTRHPDGSVSYGFSIENTDPINAVDFDVQGGGFVDGFNGVDDFTVGPSDPFSFQGRFGNGEDHGAQYCSANPTSQAGSMLVMSDQAKARGLQGDVSYGFTLTNTDPDFPVKFNVQGGGFI